MKRTIRKNAGVALILLFCLTSSSTPGKGTSEAPPLSRGRGAFVLETLINDDGVPAVVRERARQAKANGAETSDKPLLLRVMLYDDPLLPAGSKREMLHPIVVGGHDLCGIRIREERVDSGGKTTVVQEDYPIYVRYLMTHFALEIPWPDELKIRDNGQRKDTVLWERYLVETIDQLIRRIRKQAPSRGHDVEMPPVWISIPKLNELRVFICVYNMAGQESDYIEVENLFGPEHKVEAFKAMGLAAGRRPQ